MSNPAVCKKVSINLYKAMDNRKQVLIKFKEEGGTHMNKGLLKVLIILGVLAYAISPIDAFPGPVDDLVIIILGVIANRRIVARKEADVIDAEPY